MSTGDAALQNFRNKYPGSYDDIPDQQLAQLLIKKWPVYQDLLGDIANPKPKHDAPDWLHSAASAVQGAETAIGGVKSALANAPGIKQIGEAKTAVANAPGFRDIGNVGKDVMGALTTPINIPGAPSGAPGSDPLSRWSAAHPESSKDIGILINAGLTAVSLIPILGQGVRGVAVVTALAQAATRGEGKAALMAAAKTAITKGKQALFTRSQLTHGKTVADAPPPAKTAPEVGVPKPAGQEGGQYITTETRPGGGTQIRHDPQPGTLSPTVPKPTTREQKIVASDTVTPERKAIHETTAANQDAQANFERAFKQAKMRAQGLTPRKSLLRSFVGIPWWSLRDYGDLGRQIIGLANDVRMDNNVAGKRLEDIMRGLPQLSKAEGWQLESVLEGKTPVEKATSGVQDWYHTWQPILQQELPENTKLAGLKMKDAQGNLVDFQTNEAYSTHSIDHDAVDKLLRKRDNHPVRQQVIQQLMDANHLTQDQAVVALNARAERFGARGAVGKEFLHSRQPLALPRQIRINPTEALPKHYMAVSREVSRALRLGVENGKIEGLLQDITGQYGVEAGTWAEGATRILRGFSGVSPNDLKNMRAVDKIANYMLPTLAGPGWLEKHLTQISNTFRYTGVTRVTEAAGRWLFTPEGRATMERMKPLVERSDLSSIYEQGRMLSGAKKITSVMTVGLPQFYRRMKLLSSYAGRLFGEDALKVIQSGQSMGGLTPERAKNLFQMSGTNPEELAALAHNPQAMQEALDSFGAFIGEDTFFGPNSLSYSDFMRQPYGRAFFMLRQYAAREANWFYDQIVRNGRADLPATAEMLAMKFAGGIATTKLLNATKAALQEIISNGNTATWAGFTDNYANNSPSEGVQIVDAIINGFASLPIEMIVYPLRYGRGSFDREMRYGQEFAPAGFQRLASIFGGVAGPLYDAAVGAKEGQDFDLAEVARQITRNELLTLGTSNVTKPLADTLVP
jgi:hypothetical protein